MSDLDSRCLDAFPLWLRSLGDDARALASLLGNGAVSADARKKLAGALNYLFKSLDLIPDGIEDLGFVDDAFVFRVAAAAACSADGGAAAADKSGALGRLGAEAKLVAEFLGADHARLERYVAGLESGAVRGRSPGDIVGDASVTSAFTSEVGAWAQSYAAPSFGRDEKNLVKLRSFLAAKLPA